MSSSQDMKDIFGKWFQLRFKPLENHKCGLHETYDLFVHFLKENYPQVEQPNRGVYLIGMSEFIGRSDENYYWHNYQFI
jgi:hypothetical protein